MDHLTRHFLPSGCWWVYSNCGLTHRSIQAWCSRSWLASPVRVVYRLGTFLRLSFQLSRFSCRCCSTFRWFIRRLGSVPSRFQQCFRKNFVALRFLIRLGWLALSFPGLVFGRGSIVERLLHLRLAFWCSFGVGFFPIFDLEWSFL